ncbi:DUF1428 domain-containing protein [Govanella unica]|uniref:DUF1428 family protein n=1 Tax=Govanella unica TaxID=2975056 RepID=A0A9X3TVY5_9PROT|nr:DUF1428 family protein [Govania unica]MDA5192966.1 DUF1428 family protein [Govania unica]
MSYIEGYVVAVPAASKDSYKSHANAAAKLLKEFGATRVVECWGDDVPDGKITDFRMSVKAKEDETVVFSWIEFPSKEIRNTAHSSMMSDPRMKAFSDMPFDGKRMIYGGFVPLLDV